VYVGSQGAPLPVLGGDNYEAPLPAGRGDDAQDGRAARHAARSGGGRAPEAGEDDAEEEDGEEADARSMGIREPQRPGQVGEEAAFWGSTAADRRPGAGQGRRWISGGRRRRRIPWGRGRGRLGRRRSGRMTAAAEEEDTTTTMAADQGRKSG
jgi:hypothetical protein